MNRYLIVTILIVCIFTYVNSQGGRGRGDGRGRGMGRGRGINRGNGQGRGMGGKMRELAKNFERVRWNVMVPTESGPEMKVKQIAFYNQTEKVVLLLSKARTRKTGFSRSAIAYDFNTNEMYIRSQQACGPAKLGSLTVTFDAIVEQIKSNEGKQLQMGDTVSIKAEDSTDSSPNTERFCKSRFNMKPEIKQYTPFTPGAEDSTDWKIIGMDKVYAIYETKN